jgi:hypothetical protein
MISYNMSELGAVIILTIFRAFSTGSRKAVDNPAPLRALSTLQELRRDLNRSRPQLKWFGIC